MNTTGTFVLRATRVGRDTVLAQIVRLVEQAQGSKAPIQRLADRVSRVFVPAVLVIAAADVRRLVRLVGPEPRLTFALTSFISVLIIACPCAMGLATPTAIMVGTGRGAESGVLIRGGEALEVAERIDTVVFDKTGTLTAAGRRSAEIVTAPGVDGASCCVSRPRSRQGASTRSARRSSRGRASDELGSRQVDGFEAVGGPRRRRRVDGHARCSSATLACWPTTASISARSRPTPSGSPRRRMTPASWSADGTADRARPRDATRSSPSAATAVGELQPQGVDVWLLSGDNAARPQAVAAGSASRPSASSPRCCPPTRRRPSAGCRPRDASWRWSATASTTLRRWPRRTSASRSAPAPTSPSRHPTSRWSAATRAWSRAALDLARRRCGHPPEPVLGVRLQRGAHPGRDGRALPVHRDRCSTRCSPRARWRSAR